MLFWLIPERRKVTRINLQKCFPAKSAAEREALHSKWFSQPFEFRPYLRVLMFSAVGVLGMLSVAGLFSLSDAEARDIVREVAQVTRGWRDVAAAAGARPAEIRRMESAFEHDDLVKALAL